MVSKDRDPHQGPGGGAATQQGNENMQRPDPHGVSAYVRIQHEAESAYEDQSCATFSYSGQCQWVRHFERRSLRLGI
jgi:hypothetical protein